MTQANSVSVSFRRARFIAALLAPTALLGSDLPQAFAQQTLLEYSQPAAGQPAQSPNTPLQPLAPQTGRYGTPVSTMQPAATVASNPYVANPYAAAATSPSYGTAAAPIADTGNPFIRVGSPRSTLMSSSAGASASANTSVGSRYAIPSTSAAATGDTASARMRYDDQVRPASYDVQPTMPMTPITPATPAAVVGGPALAVAPTDGRYSQPDNRVPPEARDNQPDDRYAQAPAAGPTNPYAQQQPTQLQGSANIQTAANLPVQPASGPAPQPLANVPQQLSGLAILRQKPLDEQAARMQHPLTPFTAWLEDALRQMDSVRDFSATFKKREFVDGKLGDQQSIFVKMRMQPFSVYMYFLDPAVQGQEVLYVAGKNGGNLLAHPIGIKQALVGTLSLAPNDPQVMEGNRYPITDFGFRRLAERFLERCRYEMQFGECEVRVIEGARVEGRLCTCVEAVHPVRRSDFRYHMCRLYIDNELNLPIRCEGYDWPERAGDKPQLIEEYTYSNLKLNIGLTDADFDAANPQYGFK